MEEDAEKQFLEAFDEFADAIFRFCYFKLGGDRELARDIAQETFLRTWEYLTLGKEVKMIRALLYKVARNLIIDHFRKKKAVSLEELALKGFEPSYDASGIKNFAEAAEVLKALGNLEPAYREILVLRYVDDLSPGEIAAILGESENAVSVRIHRGLKKAREFLKHGKKV